MAVFPLAGRAATPAQNGAALLRTPAGSPQAMQQARAMQRAERTIFGRTTGPQLWYSQTINLAQRQTVLIPKPLTLEKPHERMIIILKFRFSITVNDYDTTLPECPQNILTNFRMWGNAGNFGAQTFYQMTGATAFAMPHCYNASPSASYVEITDVATGVTTRMNPPGLPFQSAMPTAIGQYDVKIVWQLPTSPYLGHGTNAMRQSLRFALSPQDWGNSIQFQFDTGDATSFGTPNAATVTAFSSFGSDTGSPTIEFYQNFLMLGDMRGDTKQNAVVLRVERPFTQFTGIAVQTPIAILDQRITSSLLVKQGRSVTSSTGIQSYASLRNGLTDELRIVHGTTPVRYNQSNDSYRAYYADTQQLPGAFPEGYLVESFAEFQQMLNFYRGDGLEGGSNFYLYGDIEEANGANLIAIMQEEVIQGNGGGPFGPIRTI